MAVVEEKKAKKVVKAEPKKSDIVDVSENAEIACKVLIEPWVTEKTHNAIADNKYAFRVVRKSTKKQVKAAVEEIYGVKVEKITMTNIKPKRKAYGRHMAIKAGIRKATVRLKKGDKIELFKGA